jgi:hypothetical protein
MERVRIRHLSGSRVGSTEEFVFDGTNELSIGRDSSSSIKFDRGKDDLVSRFHAKIVCGMGRQHEYRIADLGSTNGTFVNNKRVISSARLVPGDLIRLGPNGPQLRFELSPQPRAPRGLLAMTMAHATVRGTVITASKEFVSAFLELTEKRNYLGLFFRVLPSPTDETMRIINHGDRVSPFRFMAFAYTVFAATELAEPLFSGGISFAEETAKMLLVLVFFLVFSTIQYKISRRVSRANRTFHNYLVMSAIVGGMGWLLLGAAQGVALASELLGGILVLGAAVYTATHSIKTSKLFWRMPYGKIILYSFLSAIVASIVFVVLAGLLGLTAGAFVGSMR